MELSPDTLRLSLVICMLGLAILAAFYLRRRKLTFLEYLGWGLLIVFVPLIGPFLVILLRPGRLGERAK